MIWSGSLTSFSARHIPFAGVAAEIEIVGDAVAGVKIGHAGPDRQDLAGGFIAGDERQPRRLVETGAIVHVDEVQADGMLADANLAGSRRGHIHGFIYQGFRTPYLVHAHGLDHIRRSIGISLRSSESHRGRVVNSMSPRMTPIG